MRSLFITLGFLALAGCSGGSIALITVESGLDVPTQIDEVVVQIEGRSASARLVDGASLPATLELRASGDRLGPFELRVVGRLGGVEVASATRPITFVEGATIAVTVRLEASCAGVSCPMGERCEAGSCVPDAMDGGMGDAGPVDAGGGDAGGGDAGGGDACVDETCNGRDDDCDGDVDEVGCDPCVRSTFFDHVYLACDLPRTADAARAYCVGLGYDLVTIDEAVENDHVNGQRSSLGPEPYIGLRRESGDVFAWADGSASPYRRWQGSEPALGDCVVMRTNGAWQTADCATEHPFFCEVGR